eukprot:jgi/Mesvir1/27230/Mv26374-RA.1
MPVRRCQSPASTRAKWKRKRQHKCIHMMTSTESTMVMKAFREYTLKSLKYVASFTRNETALHIRARDANYIRVVS